MKCKYSFTLLSEKDLGFLRDGGNSKIFLVFGVSGTLFVLHANERIKSKLIYTRKNKTGTRAFMSCKEKGWRNTVPPSLCCTFDISKK